MDKSQASFLKWFEIEEILHNKEIKPTTITNALPPSDFRKILSIGIRKCFDTLNETDPLITNIHKALKKAVQAININDDKNDENNENNAYNCESPFEIENLHFKILQFLSFKSLMKCSCVDKNWLHKVYDARSTYYLDVNEESNSILQVRNIYSQFRLIKKLRLGDWNEKNFNLNTFLMQLSKFKKIEQFLIVKNTKNKTTLFGRRPQRSRSGRYNNYGEGNNNKGYLCLMNAANRHPYRDEIITDILVNNCATITKLSIEICIENDKFHQCLQQASINRFNRLTSVGISSDSGGGSSAGRGIIHPTQVTMNIDEIVCKIIKTAINLKHLSFWIGQNDFLNINDKLEFKCNNVNLLDCVTVLGDPAYITKEQTKNVARFLCGGSSGGGVGDVGGKEKDIITEKLVIRLNNIKAVDEYGACQTAASFVEYINLNSQSLRNLEIEYVDTRNVGVNVSDMTELLQLLNELNKISKKNQMLQLKVNIKHCTHVYNKNKTKNTNKNRNSDCEYVNTPTFSQFSRICHLMQGINVNMNVNHNILLNFIFIVSSGVSDYNHNNQIWDLASKNVFEKLGFTQEKKQEETEKGTEEKNNNNKGLTFEECVRKFNKHKVARYCNWDEHNNNNNNNNNNSYRKCFLYKSFPERESILLRFIDYDNDEIKTKFVSVNKEEFPTKNIEFSVDQSIVDEKAVSLGLDANLLKYKENERVLDEGCQFYFQNRFITKTEQFRQILKNPRMYVDIKSIFGDAHGKWIPPDCFNTISVFVNGKRVPFPWHHSFIVETL